MYSLLVAQLVLLVLARVNYLSMKIILRGVEMPELFTAYMMPAEIKILPLEENISGGILEAVL